MEPQPLGPTEWTQIAHALQLLVVFVALTINAAFAFLLAWAILPSLVATADLPTDLLRVRRVVLPIGVVSVVLLLLALGRALLLATDVAGRIHSRSAI
jgi:hypothetical protein